VRVNVKKYVDKSIYFIVANNTSSSIVFSFF